MKECGGGGMKARWIAARVLRARNDEVGAGAAKKQGVDARLRGHDVERAWQDAA
jgi:hypothetical protein